jgi:hypothetical protein
VYPSSGLEARPLSDTQHLDGWLDRIAATGDGTSWLVGRAIVTCVREKRRGAIPLRRLSLIAQLPHEVVAAVIYGMRADGRLQFQRTGSENNARFQFNIPIDALESAWVDRRRNHRRPAAVNISTPEWVASRLASTQHGRA